MYELAKAAVNELISRDAIFGARDWRQGRAGSDRSQRQAHILQRQCGTARFDTVFAQAGPRPALHSVVIAGIRSNSLRLAARY